MDPVPRGANFARIKMLWEIGVHVASDPSARLTNNRDMCIVVGSGSSDKFQPSLRMATGSPLLAHDVARGDLDLSIMNPSSLLTQAYRGTGMFTEPLAVRALANYPSWDRFVLAVHPRTGLRSLAELKERRFPLGLSTRGDPAHATRILTDQLFALYGFTLADLESWGGKLQLVTRPGEKSRLDGMQDGNIDAVFDEGIGTWIETALAAGFILLTLEKSVLAQLEAIGWRQVVLPAGRYRGLSADHVCLDFGGWPLYTRASLPDQQAYLICSALQEREELIPWDERAYTGLSQLARDTEATPIDVPFHPGAERWYREHGFGN
jgi:TRAP-type uncharacterized transport system substrate-binding protein